jgi:hypothetical protein
MNPSLKTDFAQLWVFPQPVKPDVDYIAFYAGDKSPAYPKTEFFRSL